MEGQQLFDVAIQVLLFAVLVTAATTDLLFQKVYNWTTYPAIAFGLTLGFCAHDWPGLRDNLLGLSVGLLVFGVAWLGKLVGTADMKLMAAIGAIKGIHFIVPAMWYSSLVGCALALGYLVYKGAFLRGLGRSARMALFMKVPELEASDPIARRQEYAVPIAIGTFIAWALVELGPMTAPGVPQ